MAPLRYFRLVLVGKALTCLLNIWLFQHSYLAIASIPGRFGFLTSEFSGLDIPWGREFIKPCDAPWWFICINGMWFKCVGGALYPLAKRGDLSILGSSKSLNGKIWLKLNYWKVSFAGKIMSTFNLSLHLASLLQILSKASDQKIIERFWEWFHAFKLKKLTENAS